VSAGLSGTASAEAPPLPAAGSSFYTAMRILPRAQRDAMYAIYAFCRAVDDVADEGGTREAKRVELDRWRTDVDALYEGRVVPRTAPLAEATKRFGLRREDFHAVIDGMAMDADADIRAPDEATLDLYCDRVASAVGRLSVRVFGLEEGPGIELAHHLGRALQLTNILRDIDEDAERGRLYLPREGLERAGLAEAEPAAAIADPRIAEVCAAVAARAKAHYRMAARVMDDAPRRAVKAPRLMAAAYGPVLDRLVARGWTAPRPRVGVDKLRLVGAALRYGLF
jgi:presqualene diphosphate synthase